MISEFIPVEIVVTESNDPRSYRLSSKKLLDSSFKLRYQVVDAIQEVMESSKSGKIKNEGIYYNILKMQLLKL